MINIGTKLAHSSSPILRKPPRLSAGSYLNVTLDPFAEDGDFVVGRARKRTRFARKSDTWRLVDDSEQPQYEQAEVAQSATDQQEGLSQQFPSLPSQNVDAEFVKPSASGDKDDIEVATPDPPSSDSAEVRREKVDMSMESERPEHEEINGPENRQVSVPVNDHDAIIQGSTHLDTRPSERLTQSTVSSFLGMESELVSTNEKADEIPRAKIPLLPPPQSPGLPFVSPLVAYSGTEGGFFHDKLSSDWRLATTSSQPSPLASACVISELVDSDALIQQSLPVLVPHKYFNDVDDIRAAIQRDAELNETIPEVDEDMHTKQQLFSEEALQYFGERHHVVTPEAEDPAIKSTTLHFLETEPIPAPEIADYTFATPDSARPQRIEVEVEDMYEPAMSSTNAFLAPNHLQSLGEVGPSQDESVDFLDPRLEGAEELAVEPAEESDQPPAERLPNGTWQDRLHVSAIDAVSGDRCSAPPFPFQQYKSKRRSRKSSSTTAPAPRSYDGASDEPVGVIHSDSSKTSVRMSIIEMAESTVIDDEDGLPARTHLGRSNVVMDHPEIDVDKRVVESSCSPDAESRTPEAAVQLVDIEDDTFMQDATVALASTGQDSLRVIEAAIDEQENTIGSLGQSADLDITLAPAPLPHEVLTFAGSQQQSSPDHEGYAMDPALLPDPQATREVSETRLPETNRNNDQTPAVQHNAASSHLSESAQSDLTPARIAPQRLSRKSALPDNILNPYFTPRKRTIMESSSSKENIIPSGQGAGDSSTVDPASDQIMRSPGEDDLPEVRLVSPHDSAAESLKHSKTSVTNLSRLAAAPDPAYLRETANTGTAPTRPKVMKPEETKPVATVPIKKKVYAKKGHSTGANYYPYIASLGEHVGKVVDVLVVSEALTQTQRQSPDGPQDYTAVMYVTDMEHGEDHAECQVRIYRRQKEALPIVDRGDILLLRDFEVRPYFIPNVKDDAKTSGKDGAKGDDKDDRFPLLRTYGLRSTKTSAWAIWRLANNSARPEGWNHQEPEIPGPPMDVTEKDLERAHALAARWDGGEQDQFFNRYVVPEDMPESPWPKREGKRRTLFKKMSKMFERSSSKKDTKSYTPPEQAQNENVVGAVSDTDTGGTGSKQARFAENEETYEATTGHARRSVESSSSRTDEKTSIATPVESNRGSPTEPFPMFSVETKTKAENDTAEAAESAATATPDTPRVASSTPTSTRKVRRGRDSHRSQSVIHELRDGTKYVDGDRRTSGSLVHELRDGTVYVDED